MKQDDMVESFRVSLMTLTVMIALGMALFDGSHSPANSQIMTNAKMAARLIGDLSSMPSGKKVKPSISAGFSSATVADVSQLALCPSK